MKNILISGFLFIFALSAQAQQGDKVDLKQIEDQFWSAKDTDFSVVQNRAFPKEGRFYLTASGGTLMNDPFVSASVTRLGAGYYFSERWGVEVAQETIASADNKATQYFKSQSQFPNYNLLKGYQSVSLSWVPFYAKMSFIDRKILYFDMQFNVGIGTKTYELFMQNGENEKQSSSGYHFDVTQNIFFTRNFAFRIDIKNQWAPQQRKNSATELDLGTEVVNDSSLLLGINFFF